MRPDSPYAVVVPVAADPTELDRLADLVDSLVYYGPPPGWLIVVDDSPSPRDFRSALKSTPFETVLLKNPRRGRGTGHLGGLAFGVLSALEWVWRNTRCSYVLKMDTDSLVIGELSALDQITGDACLGIAGVIGRTANKASEPPGWEEARLSPILRAAIDVLADLPQLVPLGGGELGNIPLNETQRASVHALAPDILRAVENGYAGLRYCQGGGYAVTRNFLLQMETRGCYERARNWMYLPFGEDITVSMYASTLGLSLVDKSAPGEPFALAWQGLPFGLPELSARKNSVTHSVKNDRSHSEAEIRSYFADMRSRYGSRRRKSA